MRVLINGAADRGLCVRAPRRGPWRSGDTPAEPIDDRPEGIARDRWDVAIETDRRRDVVVECGAIRERVSQELARAVFDAVKRELERQDGEHQP